MRAALPMSYARAKMMNNAPNAANRIPDQKSWAFLICMNPPSRLSRPARPKI